MDDLDQSLLAILAENARIPLVELGRKVSLSPRAVGARIKKLEEEGVIEGYQTIVNPAKAGFTVRAFLCIKAEREKFSTLIALAREIPEVKEFHHSTGDHAFIGRILTRDDAGLERIVALFAEHASVQCERLLSTPVERRTLFS